MDEVVLSKRAKLIYEWIVGQLSHQLCHSALDAESMDPGSQAGVTLALRQQTLAELFGCSRRTIGRCLTELKAAGLLVDTGKRENRVKLYWLSSRPVSWAPWIPGQAGNDKQRSSSPMPNGHSMADSPDFQTSKTDDLVRVG